MRTSPSRNRAFSLLELIVVILIIGIVAAFVTPAASTILRGSQLTQATQVVTDQIVLARQLALTKNCVVEVRFIRFADPEIPGESSSSGVPDPSKGAFRAIQCFEVLDSGALVPMDKPQLLPQSVVMNPNSLSTLLDDASVKPAKKPDTQKDPKLPRNIDHKYEYIAFRYLQDGSTNLSSTSGTIWYLTLHNMNDTARATEANVKNGEVNFFTLQIDPVSGTTKSYRPGA